jgi:hypothetical protein
MEVLYAESAQLIDSSLPITDGNNTQWRWIHRLQLPALLAGDILQVFADGEIRLDGPINTEIATAVTLCPGWPYYAEDLWGMTGAIGYADFICRVKGENVDPQRHYVAPDLGQFYRMPCDMPQAWLHFRARARSSQPSGGVTIMGPGYGKLACTILRP